MKKLSFVAAALFAGSTAFAQFVGNGAVTGHRTYIDDAD